MDCKYFQVYEPKVGDKVLVEGKVEYVLTDNCGTEVKVFIYGAQGEVKPWFKPAALRSTERVEAPSCKRCQVEQALSAAPASKRISIDELEKLYASSKTCFDPGYNLFWQNFTKAVNDYFAAAPAPCTLTEDAKALATHLLAVPPPQWNYETIRRMARIVLAASPAEQPPVSLGFFHPGAPGWYVASAEQPGASEPQFHNSIETSFEPPIRQAVTVKLKPAPAGEESPAVGHCDDASQRPK